MANMTADERTRMEQRRGTWRERHLAALEAFKADDFDAAKLPAFHRPPHDRLRAERVVRVLNLALPMLDPQQRVQLAKSIEVRSASFIAESPIARRAEKPVPTPKSIRPGAIAFKVAKAQAVTAGIRLVGTRTPEPSRMASRSRS